MRSSFRLSVLPLGVAIAMGLALPASAGAAPILKSADSKSGPYITTLLVLEVGPGGSENFFLKARAPGTEPQMARLRQEGPSSFKTKYFRGDRNISQEVNSEQGFTFSVTTKAKRFKGIVKDTDMSTADCFNVSLQTAEGVTFATLGVNTSDCV